MSTVDHNRQTLDRWEAALRAIALAEQRMATTGYQAFPAWKRACRAARRLAGKARAARGLPPGPRPTCGATVLAWASGFFAGALVTAALLLSFR